MIGTIPSGQMTKEGQLENECPKTLLGAQLTNPGENVGKSFNWGNWLYNKALRLRKPYGGSHRGDTVFLQSDVPSNYAGRTGRKDF